MTAEAFIICAASLSGLISFIIFFHGSILHLLLVPLFLGAAWALYRYPALFIILSYSSGIFKDWLTENVGLFSTVDFTTFIFAVTLIGLLFHLLMTGEMWRLRLPAGFLALVLLTLLMMLSLFYTPSPKYGLLKAGSFLVFNWCLFFFGFWGVQSANDMKEIRFFLLATVGAVSLFSLGMLLHGIFSGRFIFSYRASFLGVNPISFANWVGAANIFCISSFPLLKGKKERIGVALLVVLFSVTMLAANSRGPLLSFMLSMGLWAFYGMKNLRAVTILKFFAGGLVLLLVLFLVLPQQLTSRYVDLFGGGSDVVSAAHSAYTINTRLFAWKTALDAAFTNLRTLMIGIGIGGFSSLFYGMDVRLYPHNMLIEVLCELGLAGVSLLVLHFVGAVTQLINYLRRQSQSERAQSMPYIMATVFLFLAAQFSGDLNDNRRIWFFLGLSLSVVNVLYREAMSRDGYEKKNY